MAELDRYTAFFRAMENVKSMKQFDAVNEKYEIWQDPEQYFRDIIRSVNIVRDLAMSLRSTDEGVAMGLLRLATREMDDIVEDVELWEHMPEGYWQCFNAFNPDHV